MDTIQLRGLRVLGVCGVLPEERERRQPLEVDLDVLADLSQASVDDELDHTIDYAAVAEIVERVIAEEQFSLLERLAGRIAEVVLADRRVSSVAVTARKLRPPVGHHLDTVGVRITRSA
jgi:7,8-dihydroneopterin aldolase/epimerase/oxygenase